MIDGQLLYSAQLSLPSGWDSPEVDSALRYICSWEGGSGYYTKILHNLSVDYAPNGNIYVSADGKCYTCMKMPFLGIRNGWLSLAFHGADIAGDILSLWQGNQLVFASESRDFFSNFVESLRKLDFGAFRFSPHGVIVFDSSEE